MPEKSKNSLAAVKPNPAAKTDISSLRINPPAVTAPSLAKIALKITVIPARKSAGSTVPPLVSRVINAEAINSAIIQTIAGKTVASVASALLAKTTMLHTRITKAHNTAKIIKLLMIIGIIRYLLEERLLLLILTPLSKNGDVITI